MVTYRLGKGTVLALLRDQGVQLRGQGLRESELPEVIQFYAAGWSLKQIGTKFKCDAETIRKALKAAGIPRRSPHG
jgi:hypothetical protein